MTMIRAVLFATMSSLLLQSVTAFTPSTQRVPVVPSMAPTARSLLFASQATSEEEWKDKDLYPNWFKRVFSSSTPEEKILRKFAKKQSKLEKRRQAAMDELAHYEESLEQLQGKKDEYLAGSQIAEPKVGGSFAETTLRSAVKSFLWRVVAGSVTFVTTFKFSGSVETAMKVVAGDFFSKAFTMFLGERLMNKSQAGRSGGADAASRSLAKALIWRLFAIANTLTMAIFISKDISIASKIASTDAVFKTALMFFYERVWARVEWGKKYLIEFSI